MFKSNKYSTWYFSIITNAKNQERKKSVSDYFEKHHIIPKSLGGNNEISNLVLLTYKEHFLCHWLLTKMTDHPKHKQSLYFAFFSMTRRHEKLFTSAQYEMARKHLIEAAKSRVCSDETKAKISMISSNISKETRKKKSDTMKNMIWITNGLISQRIDIETEIPLGWKNGRVISNRKTPETSTIDKLKNARPHTKIIWGGVEYTSVREASRITNTPRYKIKKELSLAV